MSKEIIYCPECAETAYHYDGRSTTQVVVRCPKCKRCLKFFPASKKMVVVNKPKIETSSGARFW